MKFFLFVSGLIYAINSFSQDEVTMNSGERIPFKSIVEKPNSIVLTLLNKEKKEIGIESVFALWYNKETQIKVSLSEAFGERNYQFIPVSVEGIINLYTKEIAGSSPGYQYSETYLFAEKTKIVKNIYKRGTFSNNGDRRKELINMVADDPKTIKTLESKGFKYNEKNIVSLIENYNLNMAPWGNASSSNSEKINIIFFERNSPRIHPTIFLDMKESYSIDPNNEIRINLEKNKIFKVCLDSLKSNCKVINTNCPTNKYYSINNTLNGIVILNSNRTEAAYYIKNFAD